MASRGGRGRGERGSGSGGGDGRGRGRGGGFRGDGGGGRGGRGGGRGGPSAIEVFSPPDGVPPLNAKVHASEDAFQKNLSSGTGIEGLRLDASFPNRPGYGTRGQKITLYANYFELLPEPNLELYRYNVDVLPIAAGKKHNQIVRLLLEFPAYSEFRDDIVTDYKSTLISRTRLHQDTVESAVQYRAEGEDDPLPNAQTYRIRVEETGTLTVSELTDYLTSTNVSAVYADKQPVLQALNIFLGHHAKTSSAFATDGSSKSFSLGQNTPRYDLRGGVTALRGFFSSVRVAACRILVNANVSHGVFYNPIPLDQLIQQYGSAKGFNLFKLQTFLKGVRVRTIHLKEKRNKAGEPIIKAKTIYGLATKNDGQAMEHPPQMPMDKPLGGGPKVVEFFLGESPGAPSSASTGQPGGKKKGKGKKGTAPAEAQAGSSSKSVGGSSSGKYISVFDFFKSAHGRTIKDGNIPVVNVGNRENPSYLPPEVCVVLPGQTYRSKLGPQETADMIKFAVRKPHLNANSIAQDSPQVIGVLPSTNVTMTRFGIAVNTKLITVPARILDAPKIKYKNDKSLFANSGSWNMAGIKFNTGGTLRNWSYLLISKNGVPDAFDAAGARHTVGEFHRALQGMGITAEQPTPGSRIVINHSEDMRLEAALQGGPGKLGQSRLMLVILPIVDTILYNHIKHLGDVKLGIHTICVVGNKFAKEQGQLQYFGNVALKFNLKLGGVNQLIDNARLGIVNEDRTMVVGIDVTHPSPGSASNAPSVSGMVASIDRWLGQWPADLRIQKSRQEMVSDLDSMLESRLLLWKKQGKHQAFPENLLIYRDGVSEGQYQLLLDIELPLLRKACAGLYPAQDTKKGLPHITIVVVGKRHHTRFYPTKTDDADRSGNPKNGTVVDRGVTEARNWDFFLQAHTALQGTARPAHYYIVLDEIFAKRKITPPFHNTADVLEDLTHCMCYLYGRATKAVSICPPAYYADKVCDRARRYLSKLFEMETPSQTPAQSLIGGTTDAKAEDILIHPDLKNTMFYI